jgi:hypothetical protein
MKTFNNIKEFISFRSYCIFCNKALVPTLHYLKPVSNFSLHLKVTGIYKRGYFEFKSKGIQSILGKINCQTNKISYKYEDYADEIDDSTVINMMNHALYAHCPHIEVLCENTDCHSYYYSSTNLNITDGIIEPFDMSWESFNMGHSWVQNDWSENKTKIYSTENPDAQAIEYDLIPFDSMPKEKLFKRIKTIITFS